MLQGVWGRPVQQPGGQGLLAPSRRCWGLAPLQHPQQLQQPQQRRSTAPAVLRPCTGATPPQTPSGSMGVWEVWGCSRRPGRPPPSRRLPLGGCRRWTVALHRQRRCAAWKAWAVGRLSCLHFVIDVSPFTHTTRSEPNPRLLPSRMLQDLDKALASLSLQVPSTNVSPCITQAC